MIEMSFGNSLYTLEGFQALQVDNRLWQGFIKHGRGFWRTF